MYVDYKFYRANVSIIQVAVALGYTCNKPKSTKKDLEFKHDSFPNVVINNPNYPSRQMYFTRGDDSDRGDVNKFVEFRLDRFNVSYNSKNEGVDKVLSSFAGVPFDFKKWQQENKFDLQNVKKQSSFSKEDYNIYTPKVASLSYLMQRGLSPETLNTFLPHIKIAQNLVDDRHYKNIGFPYVNPADNTLRGFELVNFNYKQFAAGTDKTNSAWLAEMMPQGVRAKNVFFAESAIDAMSFYQIYKHEFNFKESVFVSVGGQMSKPQASAVLDRYQNAKVFTIFDNDINGHTFSIRLAALKSNIELSLSRNMPGHIVFTLPNKTFNLPLDKVNLENFKKESGLRPDVRAAKADGKDFNEMLNNRLKKNDNELATSKIRR